MYRGLFWCKENELITVKLQCDREGNFIGETPVSLKGKQNLTHSEEWERLPKSITDGKPYNYYPRGRVEVKSGKVKIFLNPDVYSYTTLEQIKSEFQINRLTSVKAITDGSKHYEYKL